MALTRKIKAINRLPHRKYFIAIQSEKIPVFPNSTKPNASKPTATTIVEKADGLKSLSADFSLEGTTEFIPHIPPKSQ